MSFLRWAVENSKKRLVFFFMFFFKVLLSNMAQLFSQWGWWRFFLLHKVSTHSLRSNLRWRFPRHHHEPPLYITPTYRLRWTIRPPVSPCFLIYFIFAIAFFFLSILEEYRILMRIKKKNNISRGMILYFCKKITKKKHTRPNMEGIKYSTSIINLTNKNTINKV